MSEPFIHPDRQLNRSSTSHTNGGSSRENGLDRGRGGHGRGATGVRNGRHSTGEGASNEIPSGSVSKLKSQLRQTKRLLAKEDLNPDVRTTSLRRLQLLETELKRAELSNKEKKMVIKYKERQKILRKIKQILSSKTTTTTTTTTSSTSNSNSNSNSSQSENLFNYRSDLYYILHYPKLEKYIALFPEGEYVPFSEERDSLEKGSELKRWELRKRFRDVLKSGKVKIEVEDGYLGIDGEVEEGEEGNVEGEGKKRKREEEEKEEERVQEKEEPMIEMKDVIIKKKDRKKKAKVETPVVQGRSTSEADDSESEQAKKVSEVKKDTRVGTKKERKDRKDAKRKAVQLAKAEMKKAAADEAAASEKKKTDWAGDDDFFAV